MKTIKIRDYYGKWQSIPVEDHIYHEWMQMQKEENAWHKRTTYHEFVCGDDAIEGFAASCRDVLYEDYARDDEIRRLYIAIAQLSPTQRQRVLMLLEGMTYTEIARTERRNESSIRDSITGALVRLRHLLAE